MPSWKTPTTEEVERAVALLTRPEQRRYFFDKLQNPRWLPLLEQRGFFNEPPKPIKDDQRGTIQFPPWSASRYLARMAHIPDAQTDVFRIARNMPDTENIMVHTDLAEIATKLPANMAAQLARKASMWLVSPYGWPITEKLAQLIDHLAQYGETAAAERLARIALAPLKQDRSDATAHFDAWHRGRIISTITPSIVLHLGLDGLKMFGDLLQAAAPSYTKHGAPTMEDGSRIWHSKIEIDEDLHGIKNVLVTATRNVAAQLARQDAEIAARVVAELEKRPTKVFFRIALDILRREKEFLTDLVTTHLTSRNLFDDAGVRHEYQRLLHDAFPDLTPEAQDTILSWINDGPPDEDYKAWESFIGHQPSPESAARYQETWQREKLTPIAEYLPPTWAERYQGIIADVGPEEEEPEEGSLGFVESPIPKEELAAKTPIALVEYLTKWQPPDNFFGQSRAALGLDLTSIIAGDPGRMDTVLPYLRSVHPTYLRSFYYGIREAVEKGRAVSWEGVLDLADWVVTQTYVPRAQPDLFQDEEDWSSTRSAIVNLLDLALTKDLPFIHRGQVWRIILALTQDPDPTVDFEEEQGDAMDAALIGINTTRGAAIEAVIKYGLWVRKHRPAPRDFGSMTEVAAVLDEHLRTDQSRAVRSVYGRFFPWLVSLDQHWAAGHTDAIFGDARGASAWEAYLTFCAAYDDAVTLLISYYERAVDGLAEPLAEGRQRPNPQDHLAQHLMAVYWRGRLPLKEGLIDQFFALASASVRAHAMSYVGRSLLASREQIPPAIQDRLVALWTARKEATTALPEEHLRELSAFGWWFAAGKLEVAWELSELHDVLRITHHTENDMLVMERLAALAPTYTIIVIECLRELIRGDRQHSTVLGEESKVRSILSAGLHSDDPNGRTLANAMINELGILGYTQFRSLLETTS